MQLLTVLEEKYHNEMPKTSKLFYNTKSVKVEGTGKLYEVDTTYPPMSKQKQIIFSERFSLNGSGVTFSMKVNGSVTPQKFIINADENYDTIISSISFFINASLTTAELGEFGGTTPLTNGCRLILETSSDGEIIIANEIKTNYDLLRMCQGNPAPGFGASGVEFKVGNVTSNSDDGFLFILRFQDYGYDKDYVGGIKLQRGSTDKLIFEINDNLNLAPSSIDTFNASVYGYKLIP